MSAQTAISRPRILAASLWATSLTVAYSARVAMKIHKQDIVETARLARDAGRHEQQVADGRVGVEPHDFQRPKDAR